jgi:hypothetical protein
MLQSFEKLKPWFIKKLGEFNSCYYNYHVHMAKLKEEFNSMCNGLFHQNCECICNIYRPLGEVTYVANTTIVFGVRNMCDLILCLKGEIIEFHKIDCI